MTTYEFVTTFSQKGYHCYGQRFVDSFIEHVPHHLVVYHESQPNVDFHHRLTWRNLDHDPDRRKFIEDHGSDPAKVGTARHPNSQSIRFCHKVFALTDAAKRSSADWLVWVDGDVVFTAKPDMDLVCGDHDLAYLGRQDMPYTECGFVAYRIASSPVKRLLEDMRHYYTSGEMFTRPKSDWHDSRCFDICRQRSTVPPHRWHDLSAHIRGTHVWPKSALSAFCTHHKGPVRKSQAYGSIVP